MSNTARALCRAVAAGSLVSTDLVTILLEMAPSADSALIAWIVACIETVGKATEAGVCGGLVPPEDGVSDGDNTMSHVKMVQVA
jgi:hypothetical protein